MGCYHQLEALEGSVELDLWLDCKYLETDTPLLSLTVSQNVFGWMALTATAGLLGSQLIVGIIALYHPAYAPQPWHQFLIYLAYTFVATGLNAFANSLLPHINKLAVSWSIAGFTIISITVLACSSPNYNSAEFVFTNFRNSSGWPDGVAWLLGLLQGALSLTGFDATAHMVGKYMSHDRALQARDR